jgi:hypothetical protein
MAKTVIAAFLWMLVGIMVGSFLERQADVVCNIEAAKGGAGGFCSEPTSFAFFSSGVASSGLLVAANPVSCSTLPTGRKSSAQGDNPKERTSGFRGRSLHVP